MAKEYPVASAGLEQRAGFEVKQATDADGNHLGYGVEVWTKGAVNSVPLGGVNATFSRALREAADWWAQTVERPAGA